MRATTAEPKAMLVIMMDVEREYEEEFNRWYNEVHIPDLMKVPGWGRTRRFFRVAGRMKEGGEWRDLPADWVRYMALYELDDLGALEHPDYKALHAEKKTEATKQLEKHFKSHFRGIYLQIFPVIDGAEQTQA